ncbi:MAG: transposase [Myxococcales bacterium]|nr:MAG: transposase [Myxococcales bacterium]
MQVVRAFTYRIYPSVEQTARLVRWEGALWFLWNLAHAQRLTGLARPRDERVFCSAAGQMKELTALRAEVDWLADVPCDIAQGTLKTLDNAWQRCFTRHGGQPRFKARGRDAMGMTEGHRKAWSLDVKHGRDVLIFPKLGYLPIKLHRPIEGERTSATIKRDGDQWLVTLSCRVEVADHVPAPRGEPVGIDRGVANLVADSTGRLVERPTFLDTGAAKIARASRAVSHKIKGSKNREKARQKLANVYRKVRRQREHTLNVLAKHYAKNHRVVVVEDLKIGNMVRSASGTTEAPGKNVVQKRGLNRSILQMGWGQFVTLLEQKATTYGSKVVRVPAAYSSQTCAACGHVDSNNRKTQDRFVCTRCQHEEHADINAARVMRQRYEEINTRRTGGGDVCGGDASRRPVKQKLRTVRAKTRVVKGAGESPVVHGGDGLRHLRPDPRRRRGGRIESDRRGRRRRRLLGLLLGLAAGAEVAGQAVEAGLVHLRGEAGHGAQGAQHVVEQEQAEAVEHVEHGLLLLAPRGAGGHPRGGLREGVHRGGQLGLVAGADALEGGHRAHGRVAVPGQAGDDLGEGGQLRRQLLGGLGAGGRAGHGRGQGRLDGLQQLEPLDRLALEGAPLGGRRLERHPHVLLAVGAFALLGVVLVDGPGEALERVDREGHQRPGQAGLAGRLLHLGVAALEVDQGLAAQPPTILEDAIAGHLRALGLQLRVGVGQAQDGLHPPVARPEPPRGLGEPVAVLVDHGW